MYALKHWYFVKGRVTGESISEYPRPNAIASGTLGFVHELVGELDERFDLAHGASRANVQHTGTEGDLPRALTGPNGMSTNSIENTLHEMVDLRRIVIAQKQNELIAAHSGCTIL